MNLSGRRAPGSQTWRQSPLSDDEEGKRRAEQARRRAKADKRVGDFPVTDLAIAVAATGETRRKCIEGFFKGFPAGSYTGTRALLRELYGARPAPDSSLFTELPAAPWSFLESALRTACQPDHFEDNLEVSRLLFAHARASDVEATQHPPVTLRIGSRSEVRIGIDMYVTHAGRLAFEFIHLRRTRLPPKQAAILASLVHYAYCVGDYAEADVDIVSMCPVGKGSRTLTTQTVPRSAIWKKADLDREIEDVLRILREIAGA
jgi:hypothetical protein